MIRARFAIRVDASAEMGTGHVRRCLTLATSLRELGADCVFVTRDLGVDVDSLVRAAGLQTVKLQAPRGGFAPGADDPAHASWAHIGWRQDADETVAALAADPPAVLLVDQYAFDARWHDRVRAGLGSRLSAIDDLGDRPLAVDLIVDPTLDADHRAKHRLSEPFAPIILGGPDYAILGSAYRHRGPFPVRRNVESVGIFMGGSDVDNASSLAWQAVRTVLGPAAPIEIATTRVNPRLAELLKLKDRDPNAKLLIDAPDLASFFARHDLQIGAGGGATWERCYIGVPTVLVAFADNHLFVAQPLHRAGIVLFCEEGGRDAAALAKDLASLAADQPRRAAMSEQARALVDGGGIARIRVALHDLYAH
ncbi:MAG TPA: UDP-2,4-diacetamido-2,4,6-trideoxy-beta-L-altropyranose hydrolase [Allosphingosinicella sp.]|nr:UDP-2,4-diacetamido-2,4,6-trideoxy-beta-L-altropyranose hydrolase [Allosphingosinicella sp.]